MEVRLYAEEPSPLVDALESSPVLAAYSYDSQDRMLAALSGTEDVELGIVVGDTAVAQQQANSPITLEGHLMYWVDASRRAEIKALVEEDLSGALGQPVTLNLANNDVYFDANRFFFAFSSSITLLFVTSMIGISVVPNLMVEEKLARTLDLLRVSPASAAHLVAGKAVAGLFYGLISCATVLYVFRYLIINWPLAILAAVLSTFFMVAIGLLLGSYIESRAQLQLVAWFVLMPLMIPVILVALEGLVPTGAVAVMNWIPSVLVTKIFRLSLTPNANFSHFGIETIVTLVSILLLLALVILVIQRLDRG